MCCSQQWVSGPFMGVFELVEHNYREDKGGNLCFISTCFKGWTEAKAAWLRAQLWHNVQSSSSTSSCVILLWKTGKHPIVLPKELFFFSNSCKCGNEKSITVRRKQTAPSINKWASEAPLMEQTFLKCQEKEGEPRRFPFQLQCGIWQRKQPYKQCPQNNSWAGRISAFIPMTEGEANKPAPGSFCSYLEMKATKSGAALWSSSRSPAANQQCIIPWMIYPRILFLYDPDPSLLFGQQSYSHHSQQRGFYQPCVSYWKASCHKADRLHNHGEHNLPKTYRRVHNNKRELERGGKKKDFLIQNSQQRLLLH